MSTVTHTHTSLSADSAHHLVRVSWWHFTTGEEQEHEETMITPEAAFNLARNLLAAAESALHSQCRDALAGECGRCDNERMIMKKTPSGYEERVHCPDCFQRAEQAVPTMPGLWKEAEDRAYNRR